ncbi:hypothetical protein BC830DRAFT_548529 [Chytriomyces sp. MP71]|nr:hypothetical protein BC830DRAFT_548529 [Chytriomyces sp. MP71]
MVGFPHKAFLNASHDATFNSIFPSPFLTLFPLLFKYSSPSNYGISDSHAPSGTAHPAYVHDPLHSQNTRATPSDPPTPHHTQRSWLNLAQQLKYMAANSRASSHASTVASAKVSARLQTRQNIRATPQNSAKHFQEYRICSPRTHSRRPRHSLAPHCSWHPGPKPPNPRSHFRQYRSPCSTSTQFPCHRRASWATKPEYKAACFETRSDCGSAPIISVLFDTVLFVFKSRTR